MGSAAITTGDATIKPKTATNIFLIFFIIYAPFFKLIAKVDYPKKIRPLPEYG